MTLPLRGPLVALLAVLLGTAWVGPATADEVADCGALIASPFEAGFEATGVAPVDADLLQAEEVCAAAIIASPTSDQAKAGLSRIHFYYGEYDAALPLLEAAAGADNPLAQQLLADILIDGLGGIPVDEARAITLLEASTAAGFAPGQNSLAVSYERGQGVAQDVSRAAELYAAAAKQGLPVAEVNLGVLYAEGNGVAENDERATQLFMSAAEKGDAGGMNSLGVSYEVGEGIDVDLDLAMEWYRKAAAAGSIVARANIGNLYFRGLGVPQDYEIARKWITKAADDGNGFGLYLLGELHENGNGVAIDLDRAIDLYRQAAAEGSADAEDALARLGAHD
ncbi:tetratricopeptide repeat protein [Devosia sp.]|uniref:tetratricopeptide repeat protein n=1 Tax=Devosia sp. TaxID=1871048 RepID=UPI002FCA4F98